MKSTFLIIFILTTITSIGQVIRTVDFKKGQKTVITTKEKSSSFTLDQFNGKWEEVLRTTHKENHSVSFNDTLFFYFSHNDEVYTRNGINMSLKGKASVQPGNILEAAGDEFTIRSLNNGQVVLDDGDYVHTLIKKKNFWYETLPTNSVSPEKYTTAIRTNLDAIRGKWMVYRRDARPGTTDTEDLLVKLLSVGDSKTNGTNGEVTFYKKDKTETQPCTVSVDGETMYIVTDKHSWHLDIYKADGKEFIFGDPSLMYYCKAL